MKLHEMIETIKKRRPTAFSDGDITDFLNTSVRRFGRFVGTADIYSFPTAEGAALYPLPTYIGGENIKRVTVGGVMYEPALYDENMGDKTYAIEPGGYLLINPAPKGIKEAEVLFNGCAEFASLEEVTELSPDKTADEIRNIWREQDCGCADEYTDVIIYGALSDMAEAEEDIGAAANFTERVHEVLKHAKQSIYSRRGKYPAVKQAGGRAMKWTHYRHYGR